ncbi:MAG: Smr/MutS family protein [Muribaculum sp.]|nr:Smr/MutS family protein [Muribaculum sp.]
MLSAFCSGEAGRRLVAEMNFSAEFNVINRRLRETSEMSALLEAGGDIPRPNYFDLSSHLFGIRAEGAYLEPRILDALLKMMTAFKDVKAFYCKKSSDTDSPLHPWLAEVFSPLKEFPNLCTLIAKCINKFGEVNDNASEGLLKVRTALQTANGAVARAMHRAIEKASAAGLVDKDTSPAIRDGRMVIPIAAASKRAIPGIVHDESATGKTVFVEPSEVVEVSNRLRELQMQERREVIAVLVSISNEIRPHIDDILFSADILAQLDFITAKAQFARSTNANMPSLEKHCEIDWYGAVHPVLLQSLRKQGRDIVPLSLRLDPNVRFLIVSGPNAGGKSVVLKTVGIVQYMMQCGLLPTLYENSHMGIFDSVFVDIGDEQSIENDLSTYSSHLRNMKFFMQNANAESLLLADEMGSGTEPQIGGALAQAILARLSTTGCFGIVTTHYQNLKTFADDTPGFVNGAMIYDRQKLRPTFQLSIGHPGSSFALEIAGNIGLPRQVVEDAKQIVGSDYVNMDKYLLDIERDRRYWSNKRQNIHEKEKRLNDLLAKYEDSSSDLRQQRRQILSDARRQAQEIISRSNAKVEATIRQIREFQAEKERTKMIRQELKQYSESLKGDSDDSQPKLLKPLKHKSRNTAKSEKPTQVPAAKPLQPGDFVKMDDGGVVGKILSINGTKAEVAFGALRTLVQLSKLKPSSRPKPTGSNVVMTVSDSTLEDSRNRQLSFRQEIDVRGMRADEALQALTYFLDDAIQFNAKRVRILHGTGHGILKSVIREQLKVNPAVESFHDEDVRFGGAGITVVEFN